MKVVLFEIAHKICQNIWATFVIKFVTKKLKIDQSGHTDHELPPPTTKDPISSLLGPLC